MPIISKDLQPGGFRFTRCGGFQPLRGWPADCHVQWGNKGLVIKSGGGSYVTAFFEAFIAHPVTFIRGEGSTLEEAEATAFAKFERIIQCPGHEFERRKYENGAGFCKHCDLFKSDAFPPATLCVICGKNTCYTYGIDSAGNEHWFCEEHAELRCRETLPNPCDALDDDDDDDFSEFSEADTPN